MQKILESVKEISNIDVKDSEEEGTVKLVLEAYDNADIRESVFRAFAQAECPILAMQKIKTTLEDVFLELTQQTQQEAPAAQEEPTEQNMAEEQGELPEQEKEADENESDL